MANTFSIIGNNNTFGDWVATTNSLVQENNALAANNYTKATGTLTLSDPTLGLQVNTNAIVAGQLQVQGTGSSAYVQNNLRVDGQVVFQNTTLGLVNYGQANINGLLVAQGSGTGLYVANNANIAGTLNVVSPTTLQNTLSVISNATFANNATVTNTIVSNILQANSSVNTRTITVTNSATVNTLQANTSINTATITASTITLSNNVATDNAVSNTVYVTGNLTSSNVVAGNTIFSKNLGASSNVTSAGVVATSTIYGQDVGATNNVTAANMLATTTMYALNLGATANVTSSNVVAGNTIFGKNVGASSNVTAAGVVATSTIYGQSVGAAGNVTSANMLATTTIYGQDVGATNNVTSSNVVAGNTIFGKNVGASANVTAANMVATTTIYGQSLGAGGNVTAAGNVTSANMLATTTIYGQDVGATNNVTSSNVLAGNTIFGKNVGASANVTSANMVATTTIYAQDLGATNNVTSSNVLAGNTIFGKNVGASANVTAANMVATTTIYGQSVGAAGNVTSANMLATTTIYGQDVGATNNVTSSNVVAGNTIFGKNVGASANVTSANMVATATIYAQSLGASGTATASNLVATTNVTTSNIVSTNTITTANLTVTANVNSNLSVTGNVNANNINTTNSVYAANLIVASGGTITAPSITTTGSGNFGGTITAASATIAGNFVIQGSTVYSSNTFILNIAAAPSATANSEFDVYRPLTTDKIIIGGRYVIINNVATGGANNFTAIGASSNANGTSFIASANIYPAGGAIVASNAAMQWYEAGAYWAVKDVGIANNYYRVLDTSLISDSVVSTSSINPASSKAANTLNNSINSANTFLQSFTGSANTFLQANDATTLASAKSYTDSANTFLQANDATTLTSAKSYTDTSNTSLKSYSDNTFYAKTGGTITGNMSITGNLTVTGTTTTVNTTTLQTQDSLIKLAANNVVGDTLDIGFYGLANTGSAVTYHGLVRQAAGNFFLFKNITTDPSGNTLPTGSVTSTNTATLITNISGDTGVFSANLSIGSSIAAAGRNFEVSKNITGSTSSYGINQRGQVQLDVTVDAVGFRNVSNASIPSGNTLPSYSHFLASQGTLTGNVTSQYGFSAESTLITANNNYGFFSNIPSGSARYNFYANGTANNVFAGQTSLGGLIGAESLRVTPVTSAVNYIQAVGAINNDSVRLSAQGTSTTVPIAIQAKGPNSVVQIDGSDGSTAFGLELGPTITGDRVSYIDFHSDITNGDYSYRHQRLGGVNGSVEFINAGTGGHVFKTNTTNNALTIAHTANAVNYFTIAGGDGVTTTPTISAVGANANVSIALSPKGTGGLYLGSTQIHDSTGNLISTVLPASGVTPNIYGGSTQIPVLTIDNKGRITSASNTSVSTTITLNSNYGTGSVSGGGTLNVSSVAPLVTNVTVSGSTFTVTPMTSGVTAGSYGDSASVPAFAVDTYGRVTSASNVSIRSATTSIAGIVQLGDAYTSSTTTAATANIVNGLYNNLNTVSTRTYTSSNSFVGSTGTATPSSGGITFNSGNGLTVLGSGATLTVNTAQDIRTTATPTFNGLVLTNALPLAQGGTGATSAGAALTALLPTGTTSGYVLTTGGPGTFYWAAGSGGGGGATPGTTINSSRTFITATAGQTVFTAPTYVPGASQLRVYINGVRQFNSDYTETNATTVTLVTGATVNDVVMLEVDGYILNPYYANNIAFTVNSTISSTANNIQLAIDGLASIAALKAGTDFTGKVTALTPTTGTSNTVVATTAFVYNALANTSATYAHSITGNAGTATSATTATTANALNTGNNYQINTLGVGTTPDTANTGSIRAINNITAYYSDDRLKTKLGNIENALDKLMSLNGFYYEANQTAQDLGYKPTREVGLSAQEVQQVLPEVIAAAPISDKYMTIHYERVIPLLVEAIKELKHEIDVLKGN